MLPNNELATVKTVLALGPLSPPMTGQSFAFTTYVNQSIHHFTVIDSNTRPGIIRRLGYLAFTLLSIIEKAIFTDYDVVYFTCSRTAIGSLRDFTLLQCVKKSGKPIICHLHGADFKSFLLKLPEYYRRVLVGSYNNVTEFVILNDCFKADIMDVLPLVQTSVVPNFFDPAFKLLISSSSHIHDAQVIPLRCVYFSNLIASKGILDFLQAITAYAEAGNNIEADVAGKIMPDEEMSVEELEREISKFRDIPYISFHGPVYDAAKQALLESSDICILPSYYVSEALPISLVEAMACGCCIITTDHNYLPTIVPPDMGFIVNTKSPKQITSILSLLDQDRARLRSIQEYNRSKAWSTYTFEKHKSKLDHILCSSSNN